jgi:GNAT superfamily N-acetyltransferase
MSRSPRRPTLLPMTTTVTAAIRLRELGPGEEDVLDAVFAGLSPESRYRRFHGGVPALSPAMRTVLAAVDGHRHLAVAAFVGDEPVGIARLIRDAETEPAESTIGTETESTVGTVRADLAVEVVDAWQGRGVGARLVRAAIARGAAAGVTTLVADVLTTNTPMLRLLRTLLPDHTRRVSGPETRVTATLTGESTMDPFHDRAAQHRAELLAAARARRLAKRLRRPARRHTGGDAA